jgi:hypothetical protein
VQSGDLVIRDLGYFTLSFFDHLAAIGAYFLSRLSYNVYASADAAEPLHLIRHLNRFGGGEPVMEFQVFLGEKHRLPVRLVAYRLPPDVYRKRQKAAIKTHSLSDLRALDRHPHGAAVIGAGLGPSGKRRAGGVFLQNHSVAAAQRTVF